jgi:tetratricopeptide (TPR) repeat protein
MAATPFDELEADLRTGGAEAALTQLAEWFRNEQDYHGLFDTRLMQARRRLGLPIILTTPLEDLAEPLRGAVENAYLEACREAGWLLWNAGKLREAWPYLRPLADNVAVAQAIARIEPNEENRASLIEIALHEGVAPGYGFKLVLDHYGACNAITTFDAEMPRHSRVEQQIAAAHLVRRLHEDLLTNVRADVARQEGNPPNETSLDDLLRERDWVFANNNYHIDTSHLSAAVRIARVVEAPDVLRLAWNLTRYGRQLAATFQFAGDEPFGDVYPSHGLFFAAQLGEQVDEALTYFQQKARQSEVDEDRIAAAEVVVVLLVRLRRYAEAFEAHEQLIPPRARTTGFAPTLLELSRLAGDYDRLMRVCRERGDLLGFAAGLVSKGGTEGGKAT